MAWWFALFAMFTSVMAASLATQNVATRMWYGMARTGVLPHAVTIVHPRRKTPTVAVGLQFLLSMGLGLLGGALLGPAKLFILLVVIGRAERPDLGVRRLAVFAHVGLPPQFTGLP